MAAKAAEASVSVYSELSDDELLGLLFTEGDRLPMTFAVEAIGRGERLVPSLARVAGDLHNWKRKDAGWCAAIHACYLLGAIGGEEAAAALVEAFRISKDLDNDWVDEDWAPIFGRQDTKVLASLGEIALDRSCEWPRRTTAMRGMAAVASRRPEHQGEVLAFIAGIAADEKDDPDTRVWGGDILLDFGRKEHEALLLSLAETELGSFGPVYNAADVRKAFARTSPKLDEYQRDWLDFYAPANIAKRRKRWDDERLSEEEAWDWALAPLIGTEGWSARTPEEAEDRLGEFLPLARKAKAGIHWDFDELDKTELVRQYALASELLHAIGEDAEKYRLFSDYLEPGIHGWLVKLSVPMAKKGLINEACALAENWAKIVDPKRFLADRALILAEAGRGDESRRQLRENLARFPKHWFVLLRAGEALQALKDLSAAEAHYRSGLKSARHQDAIRSIRGRLAGLLKETGRSEEAEALEAENAGPDPVIHPAVETFVRDKPKTGRNFPCPCGSGKKFKKCCGK